MLQRSPVSHERHVCEGAPVALCCKRTTRLRSRSLQRALLLLTAAALVSAPVTPAHAIGLINGLGGPRGYGEEVLPGNDDGSTSAVDITPVFGAQGLNFFGANKTALYVNNNGNITFNSQSGQFTPDAITGSRAPIIAAYFADVDTRGAHVPEGSNLTYYDLDTANHILTVTWDLVGYFSNHVDKLNNFQIRLIGTQVPGDFDIEFRYERLQWTTGDASGGANGLGGTPARAGYSAGNSEDFFELPESGDQNSMLDLVSRSNVGIAGLFVFQVRSGVVTPPPTYTPSATPTVTGPPPTPSATPTVTARPATPTVTPTVGPPTCSVNPPTAVNPLDTQHDMEVTVRRGNGEPAVGVSVNGEITAGPHAGASNSGTTNASGHLHFFYTGTDPGTDTIRFNGVVDGQPFSCSATKTWEPPPPPPPCTISPAADTNLVGTGHTVSAVFRRGDGSPAAGASVSIVISSGPNSLLLADAVANAHGQVSFSYTGGRNPGTDVIEFSGSVDDQPVRCSATKTWIVAQPSCKVVPTTAVNRAGTEHTVAAIFRSGDGSPAAGAGVAISITSGTNVLLLADAVTNARGEVALSYMGSQTTRTDVIEFSGFVDDRVVRCSATKTWVLAQPTCDAVPTTNVNPTGTRHTVTAIFRRGDGSPATDAGVAISIVAGPNSLLLADAITNARGQVGFSYTGGPNAGTDVIEFSGFVDGEVVRCSATKTWVVAPPTCDVAPAIEVNRVGNRHTAVAIFRRGDGSPAAGAGVAISIASGPNALLLADAVANASGLVGFSYTGGPNPGTDVIEFSGSVDGQMVRCSTIKIWVAAQPSCDAVPTTAVNRVGTRHTVTAIFRRGDGSPAADAGVSVSITAGPNALLLADAVADAGGRVAFSYTGGRNPGTDVIEFSGFVDGQVVRCGATKTWVDAQPTCDAVPSVAVNRAGTRHTVTAIFRRANGLPAAGAGVAVSIAAGPNALLLADAVTDGRGRVAFSYTGGPNPGTDVIEFSGFVDGEVVRCSAVKTWVVTQPTCDAAPSVAINATGTRHTVTATFRRGNGSPAAGAGVAVNIAAGPNSLLLADAVADGSGQVAFSYTGGPNPGTDVIELGGVVDGQVVRCSATKTWVAAQQPTCDVTPAASINATGTRHTVTATFRRGNGSPAAGEGVAVSIAAGPNALLLADAVTDASGQVAFSYTGGPNTGTDVVDFDGFVDGRVVRCSATKTWVAAQPTCDAVPTMAVNRVGTEDSVTAILRRGDGSPAADAAVTMSIVSGPNSPRLVNARTNANGQVAFSYTGGANAGIDVIEFSGVVDNQEVRCSASKTWVAAQPTCNAVPTTAVNPVGTRHTVSAVFRRGNGAPATDANVTVRIPSGPNSSLPSENAVTNARGQVAFSYTGGVNAGTDVIEFSGVVDNQEVRCSASKTWVAAQATCDAAPATAVNATATQHTVTATFRRGDGSPAVAADVAVSIASGPNASSPVSARTNANGQVAFSYTGGTNAGTDAIEFSGTIDGQMVRCNASKTWVAPQASCEVTPATAANSVGAAHTVTAIFRRGNGAPAAGTSVAINIASGPNSSRPTEQAVTNASGQVAFSYTGGSSTGTDVIELSGTVDGQTVRCNASKAWLVAAPACDAAPETAVNPVGTQHTLTAVFRKGDGSPAADTGVAISIASGPNSSRPTEQAVTNASGQVAFSYTGGSSTGTDVIEFSGTVDGQTVRCRASKTWVAAQPTCSAAPATAVNRVGTRQTVSATFRKGDGSPAAGVGVAIGITSEAARSPLLRDALTDASGEVGFSYTGRSSPGTDVIEFSGTVDGQVVRCSATKTWVVAQPTCDVAPASAVNAAGTGHTVTATFRSGDGSPAAGVNVAFSVSSGPNAPRLGDGVTDASGQVGFSYTGGSNAGTDIVEFNGVVDGQVARCSATKTWAVAQPTCDAAPATAVNAAGTRHTVTATFKNGDGSPAPGVRVSIGIVNAPRVPLLAARMTDSNGQVGFTYTGGANASTDVIEFRGEVGGQMVRCSASKTWGAAAPTCDALPATAVNRVGTEHTLTATFRKGDGSPVPAVNVAISVASGPNASLLAGGVTNTSGQVVFPYTGGTNAGTDVIEFNGTVDGQAVRCRATNSWTGVGDCCVGDCDCTGVVRVNELVTMVSIALGNIAAAACLPGDANDNGEITIEELVRGVKNALDGCPVLGGTPTPTVTARTPTPTPTTTVRSPTPTLTGGPVVVARPASGAAVALARSLPAIPALLASLTQLAGGGSGTGLLEGTAAAVKECNGGGTRDFVCTQAVPRVPPRDYSLSFASCRLNTSDGGSVTLEGMMTARSTETGFLATCDLPPLVLSTVTVGGVTVTVRNAQGTTTSRGVFNLTGSATATPDLSSDCRIAALDMVLTGSADVQSGGIDLRLGFTATQVRVAIDTFSADCVPVVFTMTINGPLTITGPAFGGDFSGNFTDFVFTDDRSSGADVVRLSGQVNSACFGTPVTYATQTELTIPAGLACPSAGVLLISARGVTDRVSFTATGGVAIDLGNNGGAPDQTFQSCTDSALSCP